MYAGRIVEQGDAREVFADPRTPTRGRSCARPSRWRRTSCKPSGRAAQPDRPAARLPVPPPLPERDEVCATRTRPRSRSTTARACSAGCTPDDRDPGRAASRARERGDRRGGGGLIGGGTAAPDAPPVGPRGQGPEDAFAIRGSVVDRMRGRERRHREGRGRRELLVCAAGEVLGVVGESGSARRRWGAPCSAWRRPPTARSFEGREIVGLHERPSARCAPDPDGLPGPARLAQPRDDDRRSRSAIRCASTGSSRTAEQMRAGSRRRWSGSASHRPSSTWASTRATSRAGRSSGR